MAPEIFPPQFAKLRGLVCALGVVGLLGGCVAPRATLDPVTDPSAPEGASAPMPRTLGVDSTTRRTNEMLAAVGADKLEGLKPMKMDDMGGMQGMDHGKMSGGMEGMDHSKMPGMKSGAAMEGMDHSKMPGMKAGAETPATPKGQLKPGGMEGMDHSKMPGMKGSGAATPGVPAPADKTAVAEEMKKLSDEMKKTSDELKKKSDAAKEKGTR